MRRAYEAWNQGGTAWILDHLADDFEVRPLRGYLDLAESYRGEEGFVRFARDWRDAWDEITLKVERIEDLGERLVALITHEGTGRTSGVAVTEQIGHLVTLRQGEIAELVVIEGWPDTLEAAGRREQFSGRWLATTTEFRERANG